MVNPAASAGPVAAAAITADPWQGRRVLLTGHTGFKGSWLSLLLARRGAHVTGFSLPPPSSPNLFTLARVEEAVQSRIGDIADTASLAEAFNASRPEVVMHLAAQALVRRSYQDPVETYRTNVMGTVNVLEAVRKTPSVKAVVVVTTDKCYDNREWLWAYRENEPMGGADPYSSSKACAELVTAAYRRSFLSAAAGRTIGLASARAGNVIGGGDWAEDRIMTDLLASLSTGRPAEIRNPDAVRPWQHVLEPLSGYLRLAEALLEDPARYSEAFNFGPSEFDAQPVRAIADRMTGPGGLLGGGAWTLAAGAQPHEAHLLKLDSAKARAQLGWRPRLRLDDALVRVADWVKAWRAGQDMRAMTEAQIRDYFALPPLP
ncbi:MAG TPA: CDP-glucose 4,6-dehydratase [Fibrobacteria bacterium]|nr:CDP-glucose 4,6-dehydratase [Fibrobacteria bacterium]